MRRALRVHLTRIRPLGEDRRHLLIAREVSSIRLSEPFFDLLNTTRRGFVGVAT
jgi:hypothetical protein